MDRQSRTDEIGDGKREREEKQKGSLVVVNNNKKQCFMRQYWTSGCYLD